MSIRFRILIASWLLGSVVPGCHGDAFEVTDAPDSDTGDRDGSAESDADVGADTAVVDSGTVVEDASDAGTPDGPDTSTPDTGVLDT